LFAGSALQQFGRNKAMWGGGVNVQVNRAKENFASSQEQFLALAETGGRCYNIGPESPAVLLGPTDL